MAQALSVTAGLLRAAAALNTSQLETMRELRDRIDLLEARNEELEAALGLKTVLPGVLDITEAEGKILGMLYASPAIVRRAAIEAVLYAGRADADLPANIRKVIDVHVCRLRQKLGPHGVSIGLSHGVGYFMTGENKARLRALIDEERAKCPL